MRSGRVGTCLKVKSFKKQKKKKNGNIRNYKALSIYAFKGGFKRHNARFDNGEHFLFLFFFCAYLAL